MSKDRKHEAIMFTDISGYTALMGSNVLKDAVKISTHLLILLARF